MPDWKVTLPIKGTITAIVEADSEEAARKAMLEFVEDEDFDVEDTEFEWSPTKDLSKIKVESYVEEEDDDDEEEDDDEEAEEEEEI